MQIQLKQSEIEKAVRLYVAKQGINLDGKSLSINFTATRGAAGIVADLVLEDTADVVIPGFTDRAGDPEDRPKAAVVELKGDNTKEGTVGAAIAGKEPTKAVEDTKEASTGDAAAVTETSVPAESVETAASADETKTSSGSLFG